MKEVLKNRKLATYILTGLVVLQVILLLAQFYVFGNRVGSPKSSAGSDTSIFPFLIFFVFIPSFLLSKKNELSEKKRTMLMWGLVILATIVLSLMVIVFIKSQL